MMITRAKISAVRASELRRLFECGAYSLFCPRCGAYSRSALIRVNTVYAHVVHTTAKEVISRRENVCEMCQKLKNARAKRAKAIVILM